MVDSQSGRSTGGVSYQTSFPDNLSDHFLPNPDQIHVFAEARCGRSEMNNDANERGLAGTNKYVAGDLIEAGSRSLAFIYAPAGGDKPLCVDNS